MSVYAKYFIIYLYLLIVMGVAFLLGKYISKERSRNFVHICAGAGWLFYKWLFPASIHVIIISASFFLITLITKKFRIDFIERNSGSWGTILYTLSMFLMSILSYNNLLLFDVFGAVIMCLSIGDASANIFGSKYGKIKIYKNKSLIGFISCFFSMYCVLFLFKYNVGLNIPLLGLLIISILGALTELFTGQFDNIFISIVLYTSINMLISNGLDSRFIISLLFGTGMFAFSIILKLLNTSASYILFFMIFILFYCGGLKSFSVLMSIFLVIIIAEKITENKTDKLFQNINKEYGVRNERQLLANCSLAVIAQILFGITHNNAFLVVYVAVIAETIGDSIASSIGVLSKQNPIDICTFKHVQRGISGGISLIGTMSSILLCLYAGIIYYSFYNNNIINTGIVIIASLSGILLDSILGSKIQVQYYCDICQTYTEKEIHCGNYTRIVKGFRFFDNTRINILCNLFTFVIAYLMMLGR